MAQALETWHGNLRLVLKKRTSAGKVAGQALVVHEHLPGGRGVGHGVLSGHVGAHHPEPGAKERKIALLQKGLKVVFKYSSWVEVLNYFPPLKYSPKESNSALGGGDHGSIFSDGVLSRDVVLQEQTLRVLLLQSVPLSCILWRQIIRANMLRAISSVKYGYALEKIRLISNVIHSYTPDFSKEYIHQVYLRQMLKHDSF